MITYETIKNNESIKTYIERADASLKALGYTEHSYAHVGAVAKRASELPMLARSSASTCGKATWISGGKR